jgi:hypothetical protein
MTAPLRGIAIVACLLLAGAFFVLLVRCSPKGDKLDRGLYFLSGFGIAFSPSGSDLATFDENVVVVDLTLICFWVLARGKPCNLWDLGEAWGREGTEGDRWTDSGGPERPA